MSEERQLPDDGSPPGHMEKMLGKAKETQQAPAQEEQQVIGSRPENIPEKFWDAEKGEVNVEALLKSQQDAEAALRGQQQSSEEPNEGTEVPNEGNETPEDTPNQANVIAEADAEWQEKGELSDSTFANLEQVGITREMVNTYIDGQKAIVSKLQNAAYEPFGGADGYESAANWAAENLSEAEVQAIDIQLTSNNPDIVAQGAQALLRRFKEDGSYEPPSLRGSGNAGTSGGVYGSRAEMVRDMRDTRYRRDAAFRTAVEEKIRRTQRARG